MRNNFYSLSVLALMLSGCAHSNRALPTFATPAESAAYEREQAAAAGVDREKIRAVIIARNRQMQTCYEKAIDVRPGAMGKVVVEFMVNDEGKPGELTFKEIDPSMIDIQPCMREEFAKIKFPPAPPAVKEYSVAYPYRFDERVHGPTNDEAVKRSLNRTQLPEPTSKPK